MKEKTAKGIDNYLFEDNVKRLCLYDMLRRKPYLKKHIKELKRRRQALGGELK